MEIEVRPGIVSKTADGKIQCMPIRSRILSLFAEHNELQYAVPGGLIGEVDLLVRWPLPCSYMYHKACLCCSATLPLTHPHTHTHTHTHTHRCGY